MVGNEGLEGGGIAGCGMIDLQVRCIERIAAGAATGPGAAWCMDDGVDEDAGNASHFGQATESGRVDDTLAGQNHGAGGVGQQRIVEEGAENARIAGRVGLMDVNDRDIGDDGGYGEQFLAGIGIADRAQVVRCLACAVQQAGHRHEGQAEGSSAQAGDQSGVVEGLDLEPTLDLRTAIIERRTEDLLEADVGSRQTGDTPGTAEQVDVVGTGGFDDVQTLFALADEFVKCGGGAAVQGLAAGGDYCAIGNSGDSFGERDKFIGHTAKFE